MEDGCNGLCNKVMSAFVRHGQTDAGLDVPAVHAQLDEFALEQIKDAVEHLANDGRLYSTDDGHYKVASPTYERGDTYER
jgi:hypothetical protein